MSERWPFMQSFRKSLERVSYSVKVDGTDYRELSFPEEEPYASVIDTCRCLVESDSTFAGRVVSTVYLNVDEAELCFYTAPFKQREEWWTL